MGGEVFGAIDQRCVSGGVGDGGLVGAVAERGGDASGGGVCGVRVPGENWGSVSFMWNYYVHRMVCEGELGGERVCAADGVCDWAGAGGDVLGGAVCGGERTAELSHVTTIAHAETADGVVGVRGAGVGV